MSKHILLPRLVSIFNVVEFLPCVWGTYAGTVVARNIVELYTYSSASASTSKEKRKINRGMNYNVHSFQSAKWILSLTRVSGSGTESALSFSSRCEMYFASFDERNPVFEALSGKSMIMK